MRLGIYVIHVIHVVPGKEDMSTPAYQPDETKQDNDQTQRLMPPSSTVRSYVFDLFCSFLQCLDDVLKQFLILTHHT